MAFNPAELWNWMSGEKPEFATRTHDFIQKEKITGDVFLAATYDELLPNIGFGDAKRWNILTQGTIS